jgi:hypothetical protein
VARGLIDRSSWVKGLIRWVKGGISGLRGGTETTPELAFIAPGQRISYDASVGSRSAS